MSENLATMKGKVKFSDQKSKKEALDDIVDFTKRLNTSGNILQIPERSYYKELYRQLEPHIEKSEKAYLVMCSKPDDWVGKVKTPRGTLEYDLSEWYKEHTNLEPGEKDSLFGYSDFTREVESEFIKWANRKHGF